MSIKGVHLSPILTSYVHRPILVPVYKEGGLIIVTMDRDDIQRAIERGTVVAPIPYFMYTFNNSNLNSTLLAHCFENPLAGFTTGPDAYVKVSVDQFSRRTVKKPLLCSGRGTDIYGPTELCEYVWAGKPSGARSHFFVPKSEAYVLSSGQPTNVPSPFTSGVIQDYTPRLLAENLWVNAGLRRGINTYRPYARTYTIDDLANDAVSTPTPPAVDTVMPYNTDVLNVLDGGFNSFKKETDSFLGVELEVNTPDTTTERVVGIRQSLNDDVICVSDGSIVGTGLEIVTLPGTLLWHKRKLWKDFAKHTVPLLDTSASDNKVMGVHVHVNRRNPVTNAVNITTGMATKLALLVNDVTSQDFISGISLRKTGQYSKVQRKRDQRYTEPGTTGKYYQLNTSRSNTIEFRMFRTTKDVNVLFSYLEFAHSLVEYSRQAPLSQLSMSNYCQWFLRHGSRYHDLRKLRGDLIKTCAGVGLPVVKPDVRNPVSDWTFKEFKLETDKDFLDLCVMYGTGFKVSKVMPILKQWLEGRSTLPSGADYEDLPSIVSRYAVNKRAPWMRRDTIAAIRGGLSCVGCYDVPGVSDMDDIRYAIGQLT